MKREIKFKAKHNGKWIEGFIQIRKKTNDAVMWIENEHGQMTWLHVDVDTVCQFTGLLDKDGKEIFEGDLVDFSCPINGGFVESVIEYDSIDARFSINWDKKSNRVHYYFDEIDDIQVIGNIHD
jgi:uncharacterized phage protein (TIGR01671 family)